MPRVNRRQQAIKALQALILLSQLSPHLRGLLTLLQLALMQIQGLRYLSSRLDRVLRLSSWTPTSLHEMDVWRARRQVRMDRRTYDAVLDAIRGLLMFQDVKGKKKKSSLNGPLMREMELCGRLGGVEHVRRDEHLDLFTDIYGRKAHTAFAGGHHGVVNATHGASWG